jgi:hypothetical protein
MRVIEYSSGRIRRRWGSCGAVAAATVNAFNPGCQLLRANSEKLDDAGD